MYCLVWPLVIAQLLLMRNLLKSRLGRALRAIHDSELAAASCAIDPSKTKLMVFTLSAVWASLAGSLYAHTLSFVNPNPFGFVFSITLVVMVVVGGSGSLWGPLLGVTAFTLLQEALTSGTMEHLLGLAGIPEDRLQSLVVVLFGLVLILMLQFKPKGLASLTKQKRGIPDAG
jgi:branched-chain amino acid transport system permease protein